MDARNRVQRALAGETVDRPPLCMWHHFRPSASPQALAEATLDFFGALDLDIYKIMPDLPYPEPDGQPGPDWRERGPSRADAEPGPARTTRAVRQARPKAVVLVTLFSPLYWGMRWSGGADAFRQLASRDPAGTARGLEALAEDLSGLARACLGAGADGIYFATAGMGEGLWDEEGYRRWGCPYDLAVLAAAASGWCNVVHLHAATDLRWRLGRTYPAHVFSWSDRRTGIPLAEVAAELPGKTVMGGLDETGAVVRGDMDGVRQEMRDAIRQTGGRRLILANGCSVPDDIPLVHLLGVRGVVDEFEQG